MAPISSAEPQLLTDAELEWLVDVARRAIRQHVECGTYVVACAPRAALRAPGASFVTLKQRGALRGCIGSLNAHRPLTDDVTANALAAAFRDPRFKPLRDEEVSITTAQVAILTPPSAAFRVHSEDELYAQLAPGTDGLIVSHGSCRATYLPSVWEQLPAPCDFVRELRRKAGIAGTLPVQALEFQRYATQSSLAVALVT
jgi:AmmeMemoRadiSam system protein A